MWKSSSPDSLSSLPTTVLCVSPIPEVSVSPPAPRMNSRCAKCPMTLAEAPRCHLECRVDRLLCGCCWEVFDLQEIIYVHLVVCTSS